MKYLYKPKINMLGLGNILYFLLNCFIRKDDTYKVLYPKDQQKARIFKNLNLNDYIHEYTNIKLDNPFIDIGYHYYQNFNKDFTENELNDFIDKTIAKSLAFNKFNKINDKLVINIRGKDYINNPIYSFNYLEFLDKAFKYFPNIADCIIVTDDPDYVKNYFLYFIQSKIKNVTLLDQAPVDETLMFLAHSKNKIIWNSTFSCWSAYISDYIFKNDNHLTICPKAWASDAQALEKESFNLANPTWISL